MFVHNNNHIKKVQIPIQIYSKVVFTYAVEFYSDDDQSPAVKQNVVNR